MKTTKTYLVIMLPTENVDGIINRHLGIDYKESWLSPANKKGNYHLYILSDEEIKEGDWYIDDSNSVRQSITSDKDYWIRRKDYKKVIASTDKSLGQKAFPDLHPSKSNSFILLPQIPESFIQEYVKAYNEGKPITEVDLEMYPSKEYVDEQDAYGYDIAKIKINSDNTIIISLLLYN